MKKNRTYYFDKALKKNGITKVEFAKKSKIPYDTVAGWKKNNNVPDYAFVLLKKMAFSKHPIRFTPHTRIVTSVDITTKLAKRIQVAFWGTNYDCLHILGEVKKGNPKFVKPFFENIFYKDILNIFTTKELVRLLPNMANIMSKETIEFWDTVVKMQKEGGRSAA